jgi:hypothetical protein
MNTLGIFFLGLIALASLVQAFWLLRLAIEGKRLAARLDDFQHRLERDARPTLESLQRISRNLAEVSDTAVIQARRVDALVADTVLKIEETTETLQQLILRPLGPLADLAAFLKGLRRGLEVYRQLRGFDVPRRPPTRRGPEEDEHLFI